MLPKSLSLITIVALLLCLAPMPYGYYTLVRLLTAVTFCIVAYHCYGAGRKELCIACVVVAIVFQPLLKLYLGRVLWNIVDVAAAVFLGVLLWLNHSSKGTEEE